MKALAKRAWAGFLVALLSASFAFAQSASREQDRPAFTQQELDQMLAPIALYPDSLLSQILMASTYPLEVIEAARWSRDNPGLTGDQAVGAVGQNDWDPSVKSLAAFPQLLSMMDEKLDWTENLGEAFLSQESQVMDTVQTLRQRAYAAGNLSATNQQYVRQQGQTIVVEPANPQLVYVPYYDPLVVYGPWWYPTHPPVHWSPWPGYYARPGISVAFYWGPVVRISAGFFFGGFDWPRRHVNVVHVNNYYTRNSVEVARQRNVIVNNGPGVWRHDTAHRRGAGYRNEGLRHQFAQARTDYAESRRDVRRHDRVQAPYRDRAQAPEGAAQADERLKRRPPADMRPERSPRSDGRPRSARPDQSVAVATAPELHTAVVRPQRRSAAAPEARPHPEQRAAAPSAVAVSRPESLRRVLPRAESPRREQREFAGQQGSANDPADRAAQRSKGGNSREDRDSRGWHIGPGRAHP